MDLEYEDIYAYSVNRIKEKINRNYELQKQYPDKKEFYQGAIFGLFECLDMMKSDVLVLRNEGAVKDMGLLKRSINTRAKHCSTPMKKCRRIKH